ncbi:DMT family transporter [Variovorax paradoxus]|jgi:drug/metabolite transporter (DMT)-like permease|uniref:Putative DMT superfamily transporter inner membrane protein n=1 Tax=Variovorax paradoxus TaxID=34073 RepID=A0A0H2M7M1_VARPD|nr:DMT family transporter [Variovorax paradoxus]KLN58348.1 putative DMT superfamily transporter inner membrane protein [Variovorax paradoxus]
MTFSRYSTHLGLVSMAALWGASWPWGRLVAQSMPPLAAACLRFLLASAVLAVWLCRSGRLRALRALTARQWLGLAGASAVGVLGYSIFFLLALKAVPAGKAAMVVALNPVLTLFFAVLLFREPVSWKMGLGVVMAVSGALYALSGGSLAVLLPGQAGMGELLLLGCSACWVAYTLIGRAVLTSVDSLTTTTVTAVLGAVFLLVASMATEGTAAWAHLAEAPRQAWYSLAALALGATALAYAWYLHGVKVLGAGSASAYMALVPLFGVLCSNLWLAEPLTRSLLVGGVLAISGMAVMNWGRQALA